jgi:hypothetical protein
MVFKTKGCLEEKIKIEDFACFGEKTKLSIPAPALLCVDFHRMEQNLYFKFFSQERPSTQIFFS